MSSSKIFLQNRALGYVSNEIPLVTRYINRRRENLIITCVGRAFHTYSSDKLQLLSVSPQHESDITCLAADSYLVYTSCGNQIYAWRRGVELKHTYCSNHTSSIKLLFPFVAHLISIDDLGTLKVWDMKTESIYKEIQLNITATAICHPPTYTNKVLIGSVEGKLQLWNIKTGCLIYEFEGWNNCVSSLDPAPAINVVAIGFKSGKIILHNLKYDISNMTFIQEWGSVTRISFLIKRQLMISGSSNGTIVVWNLEKGKLDSLIVKAHQGSISGLQCLPEEPLLVTSSSDNSLKMWRFDSSDGSGSLFKIREGHFKPPVSIRFHGKDGANILSAGNDSSLRVFSTVTEIANKSFGRASYNRKISKKRGNKWSDSLIMPPISSFTSETTRDKEWDNIVAVHTGIPTVTTWSFNNSKMGKHKLCHKRFQQSNGQKGISATCVYLTHCGNFSVIGYSSGHIDKYNIQSGIHRGTFGNPTAHTFVRGVYVDILNQIMVSGGSDTFLKFWNFKNLNELSKLQVDDTVSFFSWSVESSFLAVALDNYDINIIDTDTRIIIRKFTGHSGPLTDMTFSPDCRWIITSAMDTTIRTWDIPSSSLIDILKVDTPCVSLSFSPTGSYLATAHVDRLGIYLWYNKTLYTHISLRHITEEDQITESLPLTGLNQESLNCSINDNRIVYISKEQIENSITTSGLNDAKWQNILNLDSIKKRNKPFQPKKPLLTAPFFLPTIESIDLQFDTGSLLAKNNSTNKVVPKTFMQTAFAQQLIKAQTLSDYQTLFEQLKLIGPSTLNYEIRGLSPEAGGNFELMVKFLELIKLVSKNNNNFELLQSYLGVFLKYNGRTLAQQTDVIHILEQISIYNSWAKLENDFMLCLSIVDYMKNN